MKYIVLPVDGALLSSEADALDVMGTLYGEAVDVIAIPVARLAPEFWDLRNRLAGLFVQKLINYRIRPAFVGDLSAQIASSEALAAYVRECQRGKDVFFVRDFAELDALP